MTRRSWMDSGGVGRLFVLILFLPMTDSVPYIAYFNRNLLPNNKYGNYLPAGVLLFNNHPNLSSSFSDHPPTSTTSPSERDIRERKTALYQHGEV